MGAATFVSCSEQHEERFPKLVEGRDWFPVFTPTIEATVASETAVTVRELDSEPVTAVSEVAVQTPQATPKSIHPPPPPAASVPLYSLSESEVEGILLEAGWPEALLGEAKSVAFCESRFHPGSVNSSSGVTGLFQLWSGWYRYSGVDALQWADPVVNAVAALGAYRYSGGWNQWACRP